MIIDPVCGMKVDKGEVEQTVEYEGARYYFCCSSCKEEFVGNPDKFIDLKPLIKLEDIWKTYQMGKVQVEALRGVSLHIAPGDFMAIMGPSGSGKSTLLNTIGCLDVPSSGKVFLEEQDISQLKQSGLAQIRGRKIGFVFQQFNLLPGLNALENVILPMTFQGVSEKKSRERAENLLNLVGLRKRIFHQPAELAGGEQQRVAIARALVNDPDVILADEPTGNLDSLTGKKIMDILINLHQEEGKTVIVVTHDPYIASYARKMFNLQDGKLLKDHALSQKFLWAEQPKGKTND